MKILVVEDEPVLLKKMEEFLGDYLDHEVVKALDGCDGHEAFASRPDDFDLVITDIKLPGLDGIALARKIRDISNIPIIFTTGHNEHEKSALISGIEVIDVLTKPFRLEQLENTINRVQADIP